MTIHSKTPLYEVDGLGVNVASPGEAVEAIVDRLDRPESFVVCTLNLDHLVKVRDLPEFRAAYSKAEIVTADGFPIVMLAYIDGVSMARTTGSDLILPLCARAAAEKIPVFLFGTTLNALCRAAQRLVAETPELDIRGAYAPPPGFSSDSDAAYEAMDMIARSGARICFVALGAPRQEIFAARAAEHVQGVAFLAIGGGLDFLAGTQVRCPPLLRRLYMEWAWRLAMEPRRLGGRYARCASLLITMLARRGTRGRPTYRQSSMADGAS